jgi:hypothetical protein
MTMLEDGEVALGALALKLVLGQVLLILARRLDR